MELSTKDATRVMKKLELELVECAHHIRGFLVVDGRRLWPVHCSFGHKDLPGHVPLLFRKSLKLSAGEFDVLRSCKMDRAAYLNLLRQKGIIR